MSVVDGKRIAKNTLLLYIRMGVVMIIGLYASRVVLDVLGESDFGLYNTVGGIVVTFSFLNGVMTSACNRYFSIEIGRNDYAALSKVFRMNVTIFIGIGLAIIVLSETLGLWYLNNKIVCPPDRQSAINWVYQFSVLSFIISMLSTPYRAIIIAKEKMKVFAYNSVVEAVLKLGVVFAIMVSPIDNLVFYALLLMLINAGVCGFYYVYCRRYYAECRYSYYWDKPLFKEIVGYTGWNVIGNMAVIGKSQGLNLVLNLFFGPVVNAARGIAYQVFYTINQLVSNFMMATVPQITKAYSSGERTQMMNLVFQSSKVSYFLLYIILLPLFFELPKILDIWLVDVPENTVVFTQLVFVNALIDSLGSPLAYAMQATGRIKWYQISVGGTLLFIVPVSYILLTTNMFRPEIVFYVSIVFSAVALLIRVIFVHVHLDMNYMEYIIKVWKPIVLVTIVSVVVPIMLEYYIADNELLRFASVLSASVLVVALTVWFLGLNREERLKVKSIITKNK